ncbi:MAG: isocitrate lyase/PEP mutase family protein [Burkholderiales bacterium]
MRSNPPSPRRRLRERLKSGPVVIAPGIYDAYGARFVEQAGFEAAYMTGNGVSASLLGRPDVGLVDLTMITSHARRVAAAVELPVICDADTGYGNAVSVRRTVEEFEAAGVAAIHIEDQASPKRCGQLPGARPVIGLAEAVGKVEAALAARRDPDFIVIARTDSAEAHGLDEAIRRARAFRKAGADVIFVEMKSGPTILDDLKRVASEVAAPCLVNMGAGGRLDDLDPDAIGRLGLRIAIYPGLERAAAGFAIREALAALKKDGNTRALRGRMLGLREYNETLGLGDVEQWERKYLR